MIYQIDVLTVEFYFYYYYLKKKIWGGGLMLFVYRKHFQFVFNLYYWGDEYPVYYKKPKKHPARCSITYCITRL